jgi:type II secretory ATPase GspE/PulE/Tfp pilus assembly ATPase PilB-like protein
LNERGLQSLSQRAYELLIHGETSLEEVYSLLTGY